MNVYVNCCPGGYIGDSDLITVDVPVSYSDEVLAYARVLSDAYDTPSDRVLKDILKEAAHEIERRYYERKDRKARKR